MSRPEVASEQSMDDILASIRKIIAEEPPAVRPPPAPRAAPHSLAGAPAASDPSVASRAAVLPVSQTADGVAAALGSAERTAAETAALPSAPESLSRALNSLSTSPAAAPTAATPAATPLGAAAAFDDLDDLMEEAPASPLRPSQGSAAIGAPAASAPLFNKPAMPAPAPQSAAAPSKAAPAEQTPGRSQADSPRSFEELLRARPLSSAAASPRSDLDAARPPAALGDLGAVVPTRSGFGAPSVETPRTEPPVAAPTRPAHSVDPFQWSGPKFGQKVGPTSEAPPFGASVLKSPQPVAPAPAPEPEAAEPSRYEVIAAMPQPAAKPPLAAMPSSAASSLVAAPGGSMPRQSAPEARAAVVTLPPSAQPSGPEFAEQDRASPAAPVASVIAQATTTEDPRAAERVTPADPVAAELPMMAAESLPPLANGDIAEAAEAGFEAAAIESTAAAASALGALAAGLAASSKSMLPPRADAFDAAPAAVQAPEPVAPVAPVSQSAGPGTAIPSTAAAPPMRMAPPPTTVTVVAAASPVPASAPGVAAMAAVAEPAPAITAAPPATAPVRTLDDTVADLLRPMLRQWLSDNMPRIVEKALRIEVAESVRGVPPRAKTD